MHQSFGEVVKQLESKGLIRKTDDKPAIAAKSAKKK
jgi:hypothetical protein